VSVVFKIDTEIREGKHFVVVSGYPNGSSDVVGPFETAVEADIMAAEALQVITDHFGDRVKTVKWGGEQQA